MSQENIDRVCKYRKLPKFRLGARCVVSGQEGRIVGGNSSCNFDVQLNDLNFALRNCHPHWLFRVHDDDGSVLYDSEAVSSEAAPSANSKIINTSKPDWPDWFLEKYRNFVEFSQKAVVSSKIPDAEENDFLAKLAFDMQAALLNKDGDFEKESELVRFLFSISNDGAITVYEISNFRIEIMLQRIKRIKK